MPPASISRWPTALLGYVVVLVTRSRSSSPMIDSAPATMLSAAVGSTSVGRAGGGAVGPWPE